MHWFLREAKLDGTLLYNINGAILFLAFSLLRIATIPWAMWAYFSCPKGQWLWFEIIHSMLLVPLPPLLNIYWYSFLCRSIAEALGIVKPRQRSAAKTQ